MPPATDARSRILEAAEAVIRREGGMALTLEAVAQAAGVSKGGLLYHFPSKEALVRALLEHHLDAFEQALAESGKPFAQAYVEMGWYDGSGGLFLSLAAALALYPELLQTIRERSRRWYARVRTPEARIALLATDGLFMAQLLGLETLGPEERQAVLERLRALAGEEAG
ncbi:MULTISPECIES: TetR/AcrR family transcriptional regulator [unclassified Meiothermus]|uniref:TetR/AcrR family transcriptional regulator n=1 Tax=unclassified Meiothermus TaxID=370471 RepID=UPI000D7C9610|nr:MULTISPECIES: TetR/AcrR family transcriptional regulator [unclassified Meiothermus]PZA06626.1 TetR/AcrR family transcriptional regulator [Meiothermus sp. Pnk-1]RYM37729.1 TetR/AcrR family transcriptional regulator [Meiothermus sp. PNK-Is4]